MQMHYMVYGVPLYANAYMVYGVPLYANALYGVWCMVYGVPLYANAVRVMVFVVHLNLKVHCDTIFCLTSHSAIINLCTHVQQG